MSALDFSGSSRESLLLVSPKMRKQSRQEVGSAVKSYSLSFSS